MYILYTVNHFSAIMIPKRECRKHLLLSMKIAIKLIKRSFIIKEATASKIINFTIFTILITACSNVGRYSNAGNTKIIDPIDFRHNNKQEPTDNEEKSNININVFKNLPPDNECSWAYLSKSTIRQNPKLFTKETLPSRKYNLSKPCTEGWYKQSFVSYTCIYKIEAPKKPSRLQSDTEKKLREMYGKSDEKSDYFLMAPEFANCHNNINCKEPVFKVTNFIKSYLTVTKPCKFDVIEDALKANGEIYNSSYLKSKYNQETIETDVEGGFQLTKWLVYCLTDKKLDKKNITSQGILESGSPDLACNITNRDTMKLGKSSLDIWEKYSPIVMILFMLYKFTDNEQYGEMLKGTKKKEIVELKPGGQKWSVLHYTNSNYFSLCITVVRHILNNTKVGKELSNDKSKLLDEALTVLVKKIVSECGVKEDTDEFYDNNLIKEITFAINDDDKKDECGISKSHYKFNDKSRCFSCFQYLCS